ncbi:hypothetical protein SMZ82_002516 [Cronobacter malonaticus]|uniref:hypothetical protein n=1 Tax=Cronobacter malonaticus TaxID=413503 RepID=UPI0005198363|nr:hypothetical protein [Cronobacter malonaticus]EGT4385368.1 hypothetical protein [Cronobacter malonaticus]EGT4422753.1 hypothetical protein [Cronobacter malonaticus]EGT4447140.1 hypothetical protein [Cronobacter malonaticus]EGT4455856.1 hypothetical protein [Cronobacter malonaticus]EKP4389671.1 hypothetical protein [Cronobacter malonaticus]
MSIYLIKRWPKLIAITVAPLGFVIVAFMAVFRLSFSDYAYSGYYRSFTDLVLIAFVDSAVAGFILALFYIFLLRRLHLPGNFYWGVAFIMAWQVGFVIFTMSDMVMHLKNIVEHILFMNDFHLNYAHVETPVEGQATAVRDFIISVLFFIGNAVVSGALAFIFSGVFSVIKKSYSS